MTCVILNLNNISVSPSILNDNLKTCDLERQLRTPKKKNNYDDNYSYQDFVVGHFAGYVEIRPDAVEHRRPRPGADGNTRNRRTWNESLF